MTSRPRTTPRYPERLSQSQVYYDLSVRARFVVFRPLVHLLTRAGVSANMISYTSVLVMAPTVWLAGTHPWATVAFVVASTVLDMIDGLVARHQGKASDKGKLVDMICDNVAYTLFVLALARAGMMTAVPALLLVYTMLLSKVLRSMTHAFLLPTDWYLKAVAGFLPNSAVGVTYLGYLLHVFAGWAWLDAIGAALAAALALDSLLFYGRIMRDTPLRDPGK